MAVATATANYKPIFEIMSLFEVWGICAADDVIFTNEDEAVTYAEELGDKCEAIYEVTDDGERIQRDDLL